MTEMTPEEVGAIVRGATRHQVLEVRYGLAERKESPEHVYVVLGCPGAGGHIVRYPFAVSRERLGADDAKGAVLDAVGVANTDLAEMVRSGGAGFQIWG